VGRRRLRDEGGIFSGVEAARGRQRRLRKSFSSSQKRTLDLPPQRSDFDDLIEPRRCEGTPLVHVIGRVLLTISECFDERGGVDTSQCGKTSHGCPRARSSNASTGDVTSPSPNSVVQRYPASFASRQIIESDGVAAIKFSSGSKRHQISATTLSSRAILDAAKNPPASSTDAELHALFAGAPDPTERNARRTIRELPSTVRYSFPHMPARPPFP